MRFDDACKYLFKGFSVRRYGWKHNVYLKLKCNKIYVHNGNSVKLLNKLSAKAIMAKDWVLADATVETKEPKDILTFFQRLNQIVTH